MANDIARVLTELDNGRTAAELESQTLVAVELLRNLLAGEIRSRGRRNVVQARSFADLLEQALRR